MTQNGENSATYIVRSSTEKNKENETKLAHDIFLIIGILFNIGV